MFNFIETPLHVIFAALTILAGVFICFLQRKILHIRIELALIFFGWHTAMCIYYYYYSIGSPSDSRGYYIRSFYPDVKFSLGTSAIDYITSIFSSLDMSYGNIFLIYHTLGFIGMLAFASALGEQTVNASRRVRWLAFLVMLLPSLSFWSSAIGKDAVTFMGAGLAAWAVLAPARRYPAVAIAFAAFLLARPHMAGIFIASYAAGAILLSRTSVMTKVVLMLVLSPIAAVTVMFGLQYAGLGEASGTGDVVEYFNRRQSLNDEGGSSVDIAGMSIPLRLFTYLFRPLFFDAGGLLGLVVSAENLIILLIFLYSIRKIVFGRTTLPRFANGFFMLFSVVSWFVLANTTANLGIAIRQKWMFLPMLILLIFSALSRRRPISRHIELPQERSLFRRTAFRHIGY
jgi:hypothetical protein